MRSGSVRSTGGGGGLQDDYKGALLSGGLVFSVCSVSSEGNFRRMSALAHLRKTIAALRAPGGCPWDQEQTHASLTRCLIDEVSELLDTIDRLDFSHMRERN